MASRDLLSFTLYKNTVLSNVRTGMGMASSVIREMGRNYTRTQLRIIMEWKQKCLTNTWVQRMDRKTAEAQRLMELQARQVDAHVADISTKLSSERKKVKLEKQARLELEGKVAALEKVLYKA